MKAREERKAKLMEWCVRTFGLQAAYSHRERARRFLEEAYELGQAAGFTIDEQEEVLRHVYTKPAGNVGQEIGGVGVTLVLFAKVCGFSADRCEEIETQRILALPPDHFRRRQNIKADAGVAMRVPDEVPVGATRIEPQRRVTPR